MLSETTGLRCYPELAGVSLEEPVLFNKCARQGGVESAFQWNAVMFMCFSELVPLWLEQGFGIQLGARRHTHIIWADNVWLLAHTCSHLQKMIDMLTE
eukprot:1270252-Karenia_brevis.AAC.1